MVKVFCDFDGTVSRGDVGDAFFRQFCSGPVDKWIERWAHGGMNSRQLYLKLLARFQATPEQVDEFIADQELDPAFPPFAEFCRRGGIPLTILSDGMDLYILPLLKRNGLQGLTVYSNEMSWCPETGWRMAFPYAAHSCPRCANCKGYHLRRLRGPEDEMIFVGDGLSDLCAVREADVVFAKGELADYCRQHGVSFQPWDTFADVQSELRRKLKRDALTRLGLKF